MFISVFRSIQMCTLSFKRFANKKMRIHIYTMWIMHDKLLATRII